MTNNEIESLARRFVDYEFGYRNGLFESVVIGLLQWLNETHQIVPNGRIHESFKSYYADMAKANDGAVLVSAFTLINRLKDLFDPKVIER